MTNRNGFLALSDLTLTRSVSEGTYSARVSRPRCNPQPRLSRSLVTSVLALVIGCASLAAPNALPAAEGSPSAKSAGQSYQLRYKFSPGDVYRVRVTHLVAVETRIRGVTETAKTRSISTKAWNVTNVDKAGNVTFTYTVEDANMWQQLSGREEIRYDSTQDKEPPAEYKHVADSVGVSMGTITVAPNGHILRRENARPQFNPGIGELTAPLPEKLVKAGQQWTTDSELPVRLADGEVKRIKTRQVYTLEKVLTGIATISVRTEVLTPVDDPAVQSQLVQRVKRGEIKFDIDAGRVLSQQMDIDETVIGFNGPDSLMKYLARLSEEELKETSVARTAKRT